MDAGVGFDFLLIVSLLLAAFRCGALHPGLEALVAPGAVRVRLDAARGLAAHLALSHDAFTSLSCGSGVDRDFHLGDPLEFSFKDVLEVWNDDLVEHDDELAQRQAPRSHLGWFMQIF